jgi:hypothetical protein
LLSWLCLIAVSLLNNQACQTSGKNEEKVQINGLKYEKQFKIGCNAQHQEVLLLHPNKARCIINHTNKEICSGCGR